MLVRLKVVIEAWRNRQAMSMGEKDGFILEKRWRMKSVYEIGT